jgi:hypothetical protein
MSSSLQFLAYLFFHFLKDEKCKGLCSLRYLLERTPCLCVDTKLEVIILFTPDLGQQNFTVYGKKLQENVGFI